MYDETEHEHVEYNNLSVVSVDTDLEVSPSVSWSAAKVPKSSWR